MAGHWCLKFKTHNIRCVRNQTNNPDWRVAMTNCVILSAYYTQKPRFVSQVSHQKRNMKKKKYFFGDFLLADFRQNLSKICHSESTLNCMYVCMYAVAAIAIETLVSVMQNKHIMMKRSVWITVPFLSCPLNRTSFQYCK